ncbi:protein YAE1 homolog isoform X2 [Coturnix japonica]|uniref:protein YAE1 homolog isoform X2 n=1 Tax=Coturnix japonica TaxID=93934 RepID=UPI0013A5CE45|nr:protein YAE1 homolog isoform X2 [Coturnix japonica]
MFFTFISNLTLSWETSESFSVFALGHKQKLSVITAAMSWVQVVASRSNEDIFDEDADEMYPVQKEWNNTMKKRLKEGYRDGVEAGKELAIQEGFNQGYRQGAELMVTCGQFKGTLNCAGSIKEKKLPILPRNPTNSVLISAQELNTKAYTPTDAADASLIDPALKLEDIHKSQGKVILEQLN